MDTNQNLTYCLITPARNESEFIESTIQSVIQQVVLPGKWVIVSDGSTDGTDAIVERYSRSFRWLELIRIPERPDRNFGGKASAFNAGYSRVRNDAFDVIGNLDADIAFDRDYFVFLLEKFARIPNLGIAGTPFREGGRQYNYRFSRTEHVSGACQMFRRACFEEIGGYVPRKEGGIDLIAVVTARMKGWKTETFPEKVCFHLRSQGSAESHFLKYMLRSGRGDYLLGVHPLWQLFRSFYQMSRNPFFLSGFLLLTGYFLAALTRPPQQVSKEFIRFRKSEQKRWLFEGWTNAVRRLNSFKSWDKA